MDTGRLTEDKGTGTFDEGKDSEMSDDDVMDKLQKYARLADSGLKCMMGFTAGLEVAERPVPDALAMVKERLLEVRNGCLQLRLQLADSVKKSGAEKGGAGEGVAE